MTDVNKRQGEGLSLFVCLCECFYEIHEESCWKSYVGSCVIIS